MVLAVIVGIVGVFAIFTYARRLALRIPDDALATNCRLVMWGIALLISAELVLRIAGVTTTSLDAAPVAFGGNLATISLFCLLVLWLFFGLRSLGLFDRFRKAFNEIARLAQERSAGALNSKE